MNRLAGLKPLNSNEIIKGVCRIISEYLPEAQIFLFGSRAKGSNRQVSDFDIAIKDRGKIPFEILTKIRDRLDHLATLKIIDIVDLNRVNTRFKEIILTTGMNVYDRNKDTN